MKLFQLTPEGFLALTPALWGLLLAGESRSRKRRQEPPIAAATADALPPGVL